MSRPKVLITNPTIPQIAVDLLSQKTELITVKEETEEQILKYVKGVDAIFYSTKVYLGKEILDAAGPQMKTIGTMSAGYNHIDIEELKKRGIKLGNTPEVLNDAVADVAVLLAIGASRRLHEGRLEMESGTWGKKFDIGRLLGQDISGSTVGIVGLGGIGQAILKRLKPFGVKQFLYTGRNEKPEGVKLGAKFVNLDTLNRESDFIILACPLNNQTTGMIDEAFFNKTKKTAVIVNISRGEVIVQDALVSALKEGKIFAAGLDVMTPEPLPANHELLKLPNVVILPHLGSATRNTRNAMAELTAQNILRGLGGEEMITPVV